MNLSANDFTAFFRELHGHEPFPWQGRLLHQLAEGGSWPSVLDLPTGSGKTAALDIAVFHLALEADRAMRRAPVRIAYVVDRRLVVDDAYRRAERLAEALQSPSGPVTRRVAEQLLLLSTERSDTARPLIARRLRGGVPREDDWARTPSQPTILCSTVDQVGSRLLFRGYGISDSMKPVHAGLLGADCLILLDEAHLAEPFRQTLHWVAVYRNERWREAPDTTPWAVSLLTATPGEHLMPELRLQEDDLQHAVLRRRLAAGKPAKLIQLSRSREEEKLDGNADGDAEDSEEAPGQRTAALVREVRRALEYFQAPARAASVPAIGVVVNRVARARFVHTRLREEFRSEIESGTMERPCLLIGPARQIEREQASERLRPIRTGEPRTLSKPLVVVATQCIEAGVDIDLDALITEVAPLDALRQRFGRLNRAGREITPYAAIVATKEEISPRARDPIYGHAVRHAWARLMEVATKVRRETVVDFGLTAFAASLSEEALSPKPNAPVMMPAHVDLLSQTSPIPAADPDVACFLHGPERQPDSVVVIWRGDIGLPSDNEDDIDRLRRLLTLVPPRAAEGVELPVSIVRAWLSGSRSTALLADVPSDVSGAESPNSRTDRHRVFRWKGHDIRSRWIRSEQIRPGDTIIVPASYGGVDEFGWNALSAATVRDVARHAAMPFAGRRFFVRVAPGLVPPEVADRLPETLAGTESRIWQEVRDALLELELPTDIRDDLLALSEARRPSSVAADLHVYGLTDEGFPRGVLFVAPFGIKSGLKAHETSSSTEDDISGSLSGLPVTLPRHSADVERRAEQFARAAGLSADRVQDLKVAGYLHDLGKADPRFQAWLHCGDPLGIGPDTSSDVLAKSGRPLPRSGRADSGLPDNWRHEAFSVRIAPLVSRFAEARDPELVLWLVGVHHGYGRPFFPHADPLDRVDRRLPAACDLPLSVPPGPGPQSLAFDWRGHDWPQLFERLRVRYGTWGLAHMEAILRLADHRASEDAKESSI